MATTTSPSFRKAMAEGWFDFDPNAAASMMAKAMLEETAPEVLAEYKRDHEEWKADEPQAIQYLTREEQEYINAKRVAAIARNRAEINRMFFGGDTNGGDQHLEAGNPE